MMAWIALLMAGLLWLAPGDAGAAEKIRLAYSAISGSQALLWVTKEVGLFEKHGLDAEVLFVEGGSKTMAALVAGDTPIAQLGGSHVVSSNLAGAGVVAIAGLVNVLEYKIMALREITRPEQLKGKKVAVATIGGAAYQATQYALEKWGLAPDKDVAMIQIGSQPARLQALMAGGVQAAALSLPATIKAQKAGLNTLMDLSVEGLEYQQTTLATTRSYMQANPETVKKVLRAYLEGIAYAKTRREETLKMMAKYFKTEDRDELEGTYNDYVLKIIPKKPYPTLKGLQLAMDELAGKNPRVKGAKPEQFLDLRFLKELDESGFIDRLYQK
jgi:ABC-type nitrate/sulfonate/bicarbonate transport system substrate-binding protein